MRISKEDQVLALAPLLKSNDFKKKATTWRRKCADGVHVVNIQGSQWGTEYYMNLGFYMSAVGNEKEPTEYRCHVRTRIAEPDRDAAQLVVELEAWFSSNGSIEELCARLTESRLPATTYGVARAYLEQNCQSFLSSHRSNQVTAAVK